MSLLSPYSGQCKEARKDLDHRGKDALVSSSNTGNTPRPTYHSCQPLAPDQGENPRPDGCPGCYGPFPLTCDLAGEGRGSLSGSAVTLQRLDQPLESVQSAGLFRQALDSEHQGGGILGGGQAGFLSSGGERGPRGPLPLELALDAVDVGQGPLLRRVAAL